MNVSGSGRLAPIRRGSVFCRSVFCRSVFRCSGFRCSALLVLCVGWLFLASQASADTLVVHLPSSPAESASRQAEAIEMLATELERALGPGSVVETKIFRRLEDLRRYMGDSAADHTFVLSDAALIDSAPDAWQLEPRLRFVLDGQGTYRRLVVVDSMSEEGGGIERLADLRGRELTVIESTAAAPGPWLGRQVFGGEIDPDGYFSSLPGATDDGEAVTDVLFGQALAAMVADFHPMVRRNLNERLKVIYESEPLSLPVLSIRSGAIDPTDASALFAALGSLDASTAGGELFTRFGFEGFELLDGPNALASRPSSATKTLDSVLPRGLDLPLPAPASAEDLPLYWTLDLPTPDEEEGSSRAPRDTL